MHKSFFQLTCEAMQHQDIPTSNIDYPSLDKLSPESIVEFAVYCAEDVLETMRLHRYQAGTFSYIETTINLVKRWLNDNKSVNESMLQDHLWYMQPYSPSSYAARSAIGVIANRLQQSRVDAMCAGTFAISLHGTIARTSYDDQESAAAESNRNSAIEQAAKRYNNYIRHLKREQTHKSTGVTKLPNSHMFLQNSETPKDLITSLAALFDNLEDNGIDNDLVLHQDNKVVLNHPEYPIKANNNFELADKIVTKHPFLVRWIRSLYA